MKVSLKIFIVILTIAIVDGCSNIPYIRTVLVNKGKKLDRIIKNSKQYVFLVRVEENRKNGKMIYGTAFVIHKNGYLVTNYHVIESKYSVKIFIVSNKYNKKLNTEVKIIYSDKQRDFVILQAKHKFKTAPKFRTSLLKHGEFLFSLNYADEAELNPCVTCLKLKPAVLMYGNFFRYKYDSLYKETLKLILQKSTAPIACGASGGPIFDKNGKVVGIISEIRVIRKDEASYPFTISVPIGYIKKHIPFK